MSTMWTWRVQHWMQEWRKVSNIDIAALEHYMIHVQTHTLYKRYTLYTIQYTPYDKHHRMYTVWYTPYAIYNMKYTPWHTCYHTLDTIYAIWYTWYDPRNRIHLVKSYLLSDATGWIGCQDDYHFTRYLNLCRLIVCFLMFHLISNWITVKWIWKKRKQITNTAVRGGAGSVS